MFELLTGKRHIYMNKRPGWGVYHYRGITGKRDDPKAFQRLMAAKGLEVLILKKYRGKKIDRDLNTLEA